MPFNHPDFDGIKAAALRETDPCARPTARHPDDVAVDALAAAMKEKLARQCAKGYGGWDTDCTQQRLSDMLRAHVEKGDPVDVANFCAFLAARGEGIAAAGAAQAVGPLGEIDRTAPERIWLQVDSGGNPDDRTGNFKDCREVSWCSERLGGIEIEYVRAASAPQAAATQAASSVGGMQVLVNAGALQMVVNALRRDADEGKAARGEMADELMATAQAAPAAQEGQDARDAGRIYTYSNQPTENVIAWRFGEACANARPGGDYIDHGLSLLQQLQEKGFGITAIAAQAAQKGGAA